MTTRAPLFLLLVALPGAASVRAQGADEAAAADAKVLAAAGLNDAAAQVAFLRKQAPDEAERRELERLVKQLSSEVFEEREGAARALVARGRAAVAPLTPALKSADLEVARRADMCLREIQQKHDPLVPAAALRELARRRPAGAVAAVLRFVPVADDGEMEEEALAALVALAEWSWANAGPELLAAVRVGAPAERRAAGYVLGRSPDAGHRAAARAMLGDTTELATQLRVAQGLLVGADKAAVPALIDLLAGPADIAGRAEDLLARAAGGPGAEVTAGDGSAEARRKQRDAWAAWWKERGDAVELARLTDRPPHLGLTLVAQVDSNKVFEIDRAGRRRWVIDVSGGPIEAHMLPGGRLLIAENVDKKVSERDLKGNVLWQIDVPDRTLSCQRLADGNTFVVTNSTVGEYTRAGQAVYSHDLTALGKSGRINSAVKLRDGRIALTAGDGKLDLYEAKSGKVIRSIAAPGLGQCYGLEEVRGGRFLAADYGAGKVVEVDGEGKVVWEHAMGGAFHAMRLPNGNTLIASHSEGKVVEVTPDGKTVAEHKADTSIWRARRR